MLALPLETRIVVERFGARLARAAITRPRGSIEDRKAPRRTQMGFSRRTRLTGKTVAVSTSEADDAATRRLSPLHQRDLVAELARHLLAMEARIAYGGDFREAGFTKLLVKAQRGYASSTGTASPELVSYLLEPLPAEERADYADAVGFIGVKFFDLDSVADDSAAASALSQAMSLRAMRREIARDVVALVAIGGRTSGYAGWRPGIAEEITSAIAADKPIYLIGGFGGSAGWYADAAFRGCKIPNAPAPSELGPETTGDLALPPVDEVVRALRGGMARNGLTNAENSHLAQSVDADEIVALVLGGLDKISD
jgi:hypothetical protein